MIFDLLFYSFDGDQLEETRRLLGLTKKKMCCPKVLKKKDSLTYQLFKTKYFPDSSIREVVDKNGSFYLWKSLL